jgi:molecular chaperone GrpE (heat shock protein)
MEETTSDTQSVNPQSPAASQDIPPDPAPVAESQSEPQTVQAGIERLEQDLKVIAESTGRTAGEIREMHKLYHNEFANRLKSMQEELERYREMEKGRVFDGILGEVAKLYSGNESVIDAITDDKPKKRIRYMFLDILQILEANGVSRLKSNPGDKRDTRHCQVVERVPTDDPALHDTVVQSRGTGFFVENRSLVKELVDVYIFTDTPAGNPAAGSPAKN